ncbi:MAG TPA: hypothetical protein ENI16_01115 [Candidatus Portnoybacteria bacterium]|nr:hypothetical protein [Candidatus Portnoybacteria bacterium]
MKKTKLISNLILILVIGGLGGILADRFLFPVLANLSFLRQTAFIQKLTDRTTVIKQTEKIIIKEETAVEEAIDRISPSLVGVESLKSGKVVARGTGFIVTGDGLVITTAQMIPAASQNYLIFNGERILAELVKKDSKMNLALLKVEKSNLSVVSMKDRNGLRLGEKIVLVGWGEEQKFVNTGIIRSMTSDLITTNLREESGLANGSPLINLKGEVIGLNLVNQGTVKAIPVDMIKSFLNL